MHDNFAGPGRGFRLDVIRLCERRRPAQKQGKDDRVFHSIAHFRVSFEIMFPRLMTLTECFSPSASR
jgi:hypothetical protein